MSRVKLVVPGELVPIHGERLDVQLFELPAKIVEIRPIIFRMQIPADDRGRAKR